MTKRTEKEIKAELKKMETFYDDFDNKDDDHDLDFAYFWGNKDDKKYPTFSGTEFFQSQELDTLVYMHDHASEIFYKKLRNVIETKKKELQLELENLND